MNSDRGPVLESRSGTFPRFVWSDPTRPFGDAVLKLETALRASGPQEIRRSSFATAITAMAGHLRASGESRDGAVQAILREVGTVSPAGEPSAAEACVRAEQMETVVRLAVDSCYGAMAPDSSPDQDTR